MQVSNLHLYGSWVALGCAAARTDTQWQHLLLWLSQFTYNFLFEKMKGFEYAHPPE